MFTSFAAEKIERSRSSLENTGTRLEAEFLGEVNKTKYKEAAYTFLHRDELAKVQTPEQQFEQTLKIKEAAQKAFEDALDFAEKNNYINFKNSVDLVEKSQLGNPEKPSKFFSSALYNYIKNRFEDKYSLKFFTATGGTHLDVAHGVDCFFKLYDKATEEELAMATIDLTKRSSKDKARADVLIKVDQDDMEKYDPSKNNENFDKKFFDEQIEKYGEMIINSLIENYQKR
jgi:hypothetical protein